MTEDNLKAQIDNDDRRKMGQDVQNYLNVSCPKCNGLMTVVKAPTDPKGFLTITYQCHNPGDSKSGMCLIVVQVTDSSRFPMAPLNPNKADTVPYIRPGDLGSGDIGWKEAAEEMIPAAEVKGLVESKKITPKKAFEGVTIRPEYPGQKATLYKIIFDAFWAMYFKDGKVDKARLETLVLKQKTNDKVKIALKTLPQWITERTGYAIRLTNGVYEITGRTRGGKGLTGLPYSDEAYRKAHGFPV